MATASPSTNRLADKHAFVTGGSAGIGAAIVQRLVEEGASVVFCDVEDTGGKQVEADVQAATGVDASKCKYVHCDVSKEQDVSRVLKANYQGKKLDILVNNAAVFLFGRVEDTTEATWDKVLDVNVKGYAWTVKRALPYLQQSSSGASIINLGSISSFIAQPAFVPYNTSKGAILQMTRCMAMDLAPHNIRANLVCPGGIDTPATARHAAAEHKTKEQVSKEMSQLHLIPRMGRPREVANAVLFLASDEASFITGHPLMVDGGWSVR